MELCIDLKRARAGYQIAKKITRAHAKTFYFASLFLPRAKRFAAYTIYALCRLSDDAVDKTDAALRNKHITSIAQQIALAYEACRLQDPLLTAFRETIKTYQIPQAYFHELIAGMRMDLQVSRYQTFDDLHLYCYRVAGVVGLMMLKIFGNTDEKAATYAQELGIAMQLTNIIRDIKEDYLLGRIYIPQDELRRFGVNETDIAEGNLSRQFIGLLQFQITRARQYYRRSQNGIILLPERRLRYVVTVMKELYAGILQAVEYNTYDVFSKRACVPLIKKIYTALRLIVTGI